MPCSLVNGSVTDQLVLCCRRCRPAADCAWKCGVHTRRVLLKHCIQGMAGLPWVLCPNDPERLISYSSLFSHCSGVERLRTKDPARAACIHARGRGRTSPAAQQQAYMHAAVAGPRLLLCGSGMVGARRGTAECTELVTHRHSGAA
eukprot:75049-Chlamydomonas_euryale.AAC.4